MPSTKKLVWEMRLNYLALHLRDKFRTLFPFLLDARRIRAIALETTTECSRKCAYCPPHHVMNIPKLRMSEEIFRRIIGSLAAHKFAGNIFFNLYGESLTDERLESWLAEARARVPAAKLIVFTNGDLLTAERFLSLKKAGLDMMPLSQHSKELDGALRRTLENLRRDHPGLYCITVIDYYGQYYDKNGDVGLLNNKGGLADVHRKPYSHCCDTESAAIDCLGNVILCNNDCTSSYVFGNVLDKDFFEIWNDAGFVYARDKLTRGEWIFEICRKCMDRSAPATPLPTGKAARLPPAFHDFREVMGKKAADSPAACGINFLSLLKAAALFLFCLSALAAVSGFRLPAALCAAALLLTAPVYYLYCLLKLRELSSAGLKETADFIFGPGSALVGALQHRGEIMSFLRESFAEPPRAVAEIGRAQGGTLALLCRAASSDALIISLDLPGSRYSGAVPFLNKGSWRGPLLRAMRGPGQDVRIIDGDSTAPASVELFRAALGGRKLDLLLIDGDHTFEGVKSDFELYSGFIRPGGVIAFHDIQPGFEDAGVAVSRFWKEYPLPGSRSEFIADPSQLSYGIGALRLPL